MNLWFSSQLQVTSVNVKPGSRSERRVIEVFRELVEDQADWITVYSTPVVKWDWRECVVEACGRRYECRPLPYTGKTTGEGRLLQASLPAAVRGDLSGSVLLYKHPTSILELRFLVGEALKTGVEAVVLVGEGVSRHAVLSGSLPILKPSTPPVVPVVTVDAASISECSEGVVRVYVDAELEEGTGGSILAGFNGRSDLSVHVSVHHDGLPQDTASIRDYIKLFKDTVLHLSRASEGRLTVVLASFTAKETGDPELNDYTWSWGSRYLLDIMDSKGLLENTLLDLNLEAGMDNRVIVKDNPVPLLSGSGEQSLQDVIDPRGVHFALDSLMYLRHGVPAISVTGLKNTVRESVKRGQLNSILEILAKRVVEIAEDPGRALKEAWSSLLVKLGESRLELRDLLTRVLELSRLTGSLSALKALTLLSSSITFMYLVTREGLNTCMEHALLSRIAGECTRSASGFKRGRIIAWSLDELIMDAEVSLSEEVLSDIARRVDSMILVKNSELLNKMLELQVCRSCLKVQ